MGVGGGVLTQVYGYEQCCEGDGVFWGMLGSCSEWKEA